MRNTIASEIEKLGFMADVSYIDNGDSDCPKHDFSISAKMKIPTKTDSDDLKKAVEASFGSNFNKNILLKVFVKNRDNFESEVEITAIVSAVNKPSEQKEFMIALTRAGELLKNWADGVAS